MRHGQSWKESYQANLNSEMQSTIATLPFAGEKPGFKG